MTVPILCFTCSSTIGHLYIPFHVMLERKRIDGGDITDNRDICQTLKINKDCCRMHILTSMPDKNLKKMLEYIYISME